MSTVAVARKDFLGTRRGKTLWAVAGLLALATGLVGAIYVPPEETAATVRVLGALASAVGVVLPIVTLVATYLAIAGERQTGGVKFLLSMPNSRLEVFLGKFLGRSLAIWLCVIAAFAVGLLAAAPKLGEVPLVTVAALVGLVCLYGSVFVAVGVGVSAAVASRSRAIAAGIGAYALTVIVYVVPVANVAAAVRYVHVDLLGMAPNPDLYNAATYTSPYVAFRKAQNLLFPAEMRNRPFASSARPPADAETLAEAVEGTGLPPYLADEVSLAVLAGWIVAALAIGYWRFERSDL